MTKISFAKTHKTGGSTLQNILLRYGFKHGHRIALPQKHWFFSLEDQFKADMVANFSWSKNRKFDIITSHRFVSCGLMPCPYTAQLPGRLFSPSDKSKNCPTTFYCIFQLVWVPMTTTQHIRVCFLSSNNTLFS